MENNTSINVNYYVNNLRKVLDFILGFVGCLLLLILVGLLILKPFNPGIITLGVVIVLIVLFFSNSFFSKINRKFIARGIIFAPLVVLVLAVIFAIWSASLIS